MANLLKEELYRFNISGKAETASEAMQKAFSTLRKKAYAEVPGPIVYMEPVAIEVINKRETSTREAFLFVFFPRDRKVVDLEILVEVKVRFADL